LIANLFEATKKINSIKEGKEQISASDLGLLSTNFRGFVNEVLGLELQEKQNTSEH
jgi:cysteinyl-tRNA synthetase